MPLCKGFKKNSEEDVVISSTGRLFLSLGALIEKDWSFLVFSFDFGTANNILSDDVCDMPRAQMAMGCKDIVCDTMSHTWSYYV